MWSKYTSGFAWFRLVVDSGEIFETADDRGLFQVLLGLLLRPPSPEEKQV